MLGSYFQSKLPQSCSSWTNITRGHWHPILNTKEYQRSHHIFCVNLQRQSTIRDKLEASILYTQLEVGTFSQFLSLPFDTYGQLATSITCFQFWHDTEPFGLHLCSAPNITLTPNPISLHNRSLMEIAVWIYDYKGSSIINRCHIYLQVISTLDLLIFGTQNIHPSYLTGEIPPSRESNILCPPVPCPPKHYWRLRSHFIQFHITPITKTTVTDWASVQIIRYSPLFYKHHFSPHLYQVENNRLTCYHLQHRQRCWTNNLYINVPCQCDINFNPDHFTPDRV